MATTFPKEFRQCMTVVHTHDDDNNIKHKKGDSFILLSVGESDTVPQKVDVVLINS